MSEPGSRADRLFLELYDELERRCRGHEMVSRALREAAGGTWAASEFDIGWNTGWFAALEVLHEKGLLCSSAPSPGETGPGL